MAALNFNTDHGYDCGYGHDHNDDDYIGQLPRIDGDQRRLRINLIFN